MARLTPDLPIVDQHVVSAWLLRSFASGGQNPGQLAVFDKLTGTVASSSPDAFMVELDAHSTQVESGIGRIEGPASQAGRALNKRVRRLSAGLYAVVDEGSQTKDQGPAISDEGVFEGIRLLVGRREVASPTRTHRLALATFVGLMYQRAPKTEQSIRKWGEAFDAGVQASLDRLMPGMQSGLGWRLEHRRQRMLAMAANIGEQLAGATMWVVRAPPWQPFCLGDSPVVATISLGHDDAWRPILAAESFVLAMPLSPDVALVFVPKRFMPVTGIDADGVAGAINRLSWRWAERYIVGRDRAALETLLDSIAEGERTTSVDAGPDTRRAFLNGVATATLTVIEAAWDRGWIGCRKTFGVFPFAAADRGIFAGPGDHS